MDRRTTAAHEENGLDVGVFFLARDVADIVDVLGRGHEEGDVAQVKTVVAVGDEGLVLAFDGHDVAGRGGVEEVAQGLVEDLRALAQFHANHNQFAIVDIYPLAHPRAFDVADNLAARQHFGVDDRVNANGAEETLVFLKRIFVVVHTGHGLAGTEFGGQHTAGHVVGLVGRDADKEVGLAHLGILEPLDGHGRVADGQQVEIAAEVAHSLAIFVHDCDIMAFARQEFCQVGAHCTCTCYDDFHFLGILGICSDTGPYRGGRAVISTPIYNKECQGLGPGLRLGKDFRDSRFHALTIHT